ncbi:MAG TPA: hypothetical protein VNA16_03295 [Abditibacteriaceae bacterium]|nr:hypothetical protein [Abditibacteriaceae bacterium]
MKPPIPAPVGDPEPLSFRVSFWHIFAPIYVIGAMGIVLIVGPGSTPSALIESLLAGAITGLIYTAIVVNIFKTVVTAEGIRGHSFWGKPVKLSWKEIATVKRTHFIGLKYLKLSSQTKKNVMWLPLFLSNKSGFKAAIKEYAGAQNPLWHYFY